MDSTIEIRRTADRIEGGAAGRLRRRRRIERSRDGEALTLRAVRRARMWSIAALWETRRIHAENGTDDGS